MIFQAVPPPAATVTLKVWLRPGPARSAGPRILLPVHVKPGGSSMPVTRTIPTSQPELNHLMLP